MPGSLGGGTLCDIIVHHRIRGEVGSWPPYTDDGLLNSIWRYRVCLQRFLGS